MIQLKHLCKKFGQRLAVDDLTLQVPAGEIYGLLGHNGAGKSTAIGMMLGQVWPTSGEVQHLRPRRDGAPPAGAAEGRRDLRKPGLLRLPERAAEPGNPELLHGPDAAASAFRRSSSGSA